MKIRISLLIPALLVIVAMTSSTFMYFYNNKHAEQQIRMEAKEQLRLDITRLQNILYNLLTEDNLSNARLNISVMAMDSSINHLVLTDEYENILIANRYSMEGEHTRQLSSFNHNIAREVRRTNHPHVEFPPHDTTLLQGFYPIILKIEDNSGLPIKRIGVLFTELSLARKLQSARHNAITQSAIQAGFMLATALIIAWLLHMLVSKRLAVLAHAARRLAEGDLKSTISIGGTDELGSLAHAFEDMRIHIKSQIHSLEQAQSSLARFNETLEQRIHERTELLNDAQRIAHIGNWIWEIDNDKLTWSDEIYRLLGYEVGEVTPSLDVFMSRLNEEDTLRVNETINDTLESGKPYTIDHRITLADGHTRWLHEEGYLKMDNGGRCLIGITQDITQHKEELEQRKSLEKKLLHVQKMESLGQLTGGIAHDFNNILSSILGFTQLAQRLEVSKNNEQLSKFLSFINESGQRAASMIAQMLAYSRSEGDVEDKKIISTTDLLIDTFNMLRPIIPSSIKLLAETSDDELFINANPVMLNQVLTNLCLNAKDSFSGKSGQIIVKVCSSHDTVETCSSCQQTIKGDYVIIHVIDNGSGIDEEVLNRIFDPFFSTKDIGKGTGMGLSMVHGIIHSHGGHINVCTTPEKGTTFSIYLPRVTENIPAIKKHSNKSTDLSNYGNKHVLVVDDELSITILLKELLEMHGYHVTSMNDSEAALAYFFDNKDMVDAVISDQTMPNLLGSEMAKTMLSLSPDLPFVLCTGYSEHINEQQALDMNITAFMTKPLNTDELLYTLNKLLLQNS